MMTITKTKTILVSVANAITKTQGLTKNWDKIDLINAAYENFLFLSLRFVRQMRLLLNYYQDIQFSFSLHSVLSYIKFKKQNSAGIRIYDLRHHSREFKPLC